MKTKYAAIVLIPLFLFGCSTSRAGNMSLSEEIQYIKTMPISHIDPNTVPDGEYIGEFPFRQKHLYQVEVTITSGKIANIQVLQNGTENKHAKNHFIIRWKSCHIS